MDDRYEAALTRLLDALDAPENVRELARAFAHRAVAVEFHLRRSIEEMAASAVYAAFRCAGNARRLEEIAAVTDLSRTALGQSYKHFARELDIELEPADPHEFVSRFAASLEIGDSAETAAHAIIDEIVGAGLHSGLSPAGVAAGAVYLADWAYFSRLTQEEIADCAGLSIMTVRERYTDCLKLLGREKGESPATLRSELSSLQ